MLCPYFTKKGLVCQMKIKEARLKAGLSQKQFSSLMHKFDRNLDVPLISRIENGHVYPTPRQVLHICNLTHTTIGALASREDVRFCAHVVKSAARVKKAPKRTKAARVAFRILESEKPGFDEALALCGYATIQSWGDAVKTELLDRAAKKQAERRTSLDEK